MPPLYSKRVSALEFVDLKVFDKEGDLVPLPNATKTSIRIGNVLVTIALTKDFGHAEVVVTKDKQVTSTVKVAL